MRFLKVVAYFLLLYNEILVGQVCPQISTYFGKSQIDEFKGVCRDNSGNIYAIGNTQSNDLPVTAGAFQSTYKANYEGFLVKFDSCGSLLWCSYFGTQGFDSGEKIAYSYADSSIVITGYTDGADLDTTYGCFQTDNAGMYDCFVAKFGLDGTARWITYFGGDNSDFSYALTIDQHCNIIIGGTSLSTSIHTSSLSFQQNLVGAVDAFVSRFNKEGQLKFSTFYGGTNAEDIHDVTTDTDGNVIGVGGSFSNNLDTSPGCLQASSNGGMDVYVIKMDSAGNRLFSTYIGGGALDDCYGVCTDAQKNIYLTGHTSSNDFYKTAVSQQTTIAGSNDNYCLKLTPTGTLVWSNIFGGTSFDSNVRGAIDGSGNVYSLINSQSTDFPMVGASNYTVNNGSEEIVLAKINNNGQLIWTSYRGGANGDYPNDLVLFNNKIIVAGSTSSSDFPVNANNYQTINAGQDDAFLTAFSATINVVNVGVKNYSFQKCVPYISSSNLIIPCENVAYVIITDLLGRTLDLKTAIDGRISLGKFCTNQLIFISGYEEDNKKSFIFKCFLSDFGQ